MQVSKRELLSLHPAHQLFPRLLQLTWTGEGSPAPFKEDVVMQGAKAGTSIPLQVALKQSLKPKPSDPDNYCPRKGQMTSPCDTTSCPLNLYATPYHCTVKASSVNMTGSFAVSATNE